MEQNETDFIAQLGMEDGAPEPNVPDTEEPLLPEEPIEEPKPEVPDEPSDPEVNEEEIAAFDEGSLTPREKMLLDRLEKITGERLDLTKVSGPTEPEVEPTTVPEAATHNFLEGLDIDEVLSSSENLNKLLLMVHGRALQEAQKLAAENIMRSLPQVISNFVTQHITMKQTVEDFYKTNSDLSHVKKTVAAVANEVQAENPDFSLDQIFDVTAKKVRQMLNLKGPPANGTNPVRQNKNPGFVPGQKGRVKVPELQGIAREINELIA